MLVGASVGASGRPAGHVVGARRAGDAKPSGAITVSAAASLTEAFAKIGTDFQKTNKGTTVTFNFGSSGTLETQIQQGAPADVVRVGRRGQHGQARDGGQVDDRRRRLRQEPARDRDQAGQPEKIKTIRPRERPDRVALRQTVPCGKYAAQILQTAGVTIPETKVTRGQDVKATLAAVTTGDADAAIVYVTDAQDGREARSRRSTIPDART